LQTADPSQALPTFLIFGILTSAPNSSAWEYDKDLYKGRNVVERNFRRIKQFRRVFTRYDKLDETYNAFIALANSTIFLRN